MPISTLLGKLSYLLLVYLFLYDVNLALELDIFIFVCDEEFLIQDSQVEIILPWSQQFDCLKDPLSENLDQGLLRFADYLMQLGRATKDTLLKCFIDSL